MLFNSFIVFSQQSPYLSWVSAFDMGWSQGFSISADSMDNIYTVGALDQNFGPITFNTISGEDSIVPKGLPGSIIQKTNDEGSIVWVKSLESNYGVVANDIVVDHDGDIIITGYYQDSTDFDPGPAQFIDTASTIMIFVLKLNQQGDFVWAKTFKNSFGSSKGITIDVDGNNNIIFAGEFSGTVDFDPDIGVFELTSAGSNDIFICKLDQFGALIWAKSNEGTSIEDCYSMNVDVNNNILLTGRFYSTVDFDPGISTFYLSNTPEEFGGMAFVQKLNSSGEFQWANAIGGYGYDFGEDISSDSQGNVYTLGRFSEDIDLDPGAGDLTITSAGNQDVFIQKVDSSGNLIWAKTFGGIAYDYGRSISVSDDGNIYICGYFENTIDLDPSADSAFFTATAYYDAFLLKLDTAGNYIWGAAYHGNSYEHPARMVLDSKNNLCIVGFFEGTCDFDPSGTNSYNMQTSVRTSYVVKFHEGFVSMPQVEREAEIISYPNPFGDKIYFNNPERIERILIFNLIGEEVGEFYINENNIDVSNLPAGTYLMNVYTNGFLHSTMVIKQ